tara:strand:- start:993 stop:1184 length:192 start_codon:yes stop_codon:yes gene_type:complete
MKRLITYITTFIKKFFKICSGVNTTRKGIMWVDVPNTCASRLEKESILYDTINRLEREIKIIK